MMEPKVTLISGTYKPLETIWAIWESSKTNCKIPSVDIISETVDKKELENLFSKVVFMGIPVGENISFTFLLEGVSISFREQMVRHRIGATCGERMGVDFIPELSKSSFWSQSMRIMNVGDFFDEKNVRIPDSVAGKKEAVTVYEECLKDIQTAYNYLVNIGIPIQDARELIPLGVQHRITWSLNICSLHHIIKKRSCWILQLGYWGPIIKGIVNELENKVHSCFRDLFLPVCFKGNDFKGCVYDHENERRCDGTDILPPCPMWCRSNNNPLYMGKELKDLYNRMIVDYTDFWGFDPEKEGEI